MAKTRVLAVIPSRYGAERFPGKPLALIAGKPLVQWVWEAARSARRVHRVIVATDDRRIAAAVRGFGGECLMTSLRCASGTDRVAEVARRVAAEVILNVQGDEPLLSGRTIDRTVGALLNDRSAVMATAAREPEDDRECGHPNTVKVVANRQGRALYFSRALIPWQGDAGGARIAPQRVHIGLYAFRRSFLFRFAAMNPSALERSEKLEQLRALEAGYGIQVVLADGPSAAVDRPEDVRKVERIMAQREARVL